MWCIAGAIIQPCQNNRRAVSEHRVVLSLIASFLLFQPHRQTAPWRNAFSFFFSLMSHTASTYFCFSKPQAKLGPKKFSFLAILCTCSSCFNEVWLFFLSSGSPIFFRERCSVIFVWHLKDGVVLLILVLVFNCDYWVDEETSSILTF